MDLMSNLVKFFLFITNFAVFCLACIVLGFSCWSLVNGDAIQDLIDAADGSWTINVYSTAAVLLICISCIIMLITFFGCFGAWKESRWMLTIYIACLIGLIGCVIAGSVLSWNQDIKAKIEEPLYNSLEQYTLNPVSEEDDAINEAWNQVMKDFKCCGVESYKDWYNNNSYFGPDGPLGYQVPLICCENVKNVTTEAEIDDCRRDPDDYAYNVVMDGCVDKAVAEIQMNAEYLFYSSLIIMIFMVANFAFALATCLNAK